MSFQGNSLDFENGRGGAGAPIKTEDGHIQTRYPITMRRDAKGGKHQEFG